MKLEDALKEIDSWNLKDDFDDFTTWTDDELLQVKFNIQLSDEEEANRFLAELRNRGIEEEYWKLRKSKRYA